MVTMIRAIAGLGTVMLVTSLASAQGPAAPASCEANLAQAHGENATCVQLYRDIAQHRSALEIQMASVRSTLGASCPAEKPVSVCVAEVMRARDEAVKKAGASK